mmetsp:Transcript_14960/g.42576  ORF Transcript_14960/g.42576 Transcript_14960/m.42576 type:complete len:246 (-) Transcript_14960:52-789(-)
MGIPNVHKVCQVESQVGHAWFINRTQALAKVHEPLGWVNEQLHLRKHPRNLVRHLGPRVSETCHRCLGEPRHNFHDSVEIILLLKVLGQLHKPPNALCSRLDIFLLQNARRDQPPNSIEMLRRPSHMRIFIRYLSPFLWIQNFNYTHRSKEIMLEDGEFLRYILWTELLEKSCPLLVRSLQHPRDAATRVAVSKRFERRASAPHVRLIRRRVGLAKPQLPIANRPFQVVRRLGEDRRDLRIAKCL